MAVFKCLSCGRLLYKPDKLPGADWHCLTCGPTTISEAEGVSPELARLLEREYWLDLAGLPAPRAPELPAGSGQAPGRGQVPRRRQLVKDDPKVMLLLLGVILAACFIGGWGWKAMAHDGDAFDGFLRFTVVFACGSLTLGLVGIVVLGIKELSRRRWLKKVNSHRRGKSTPTPTVPGPAPDADEHIERRDKLDHSAAPPSDATHLQEEPDGA
jgi:hypothetical protein